MHDLDPLWPREVLGVRRRMVPDRLNESRLCTVDAGERPIGDEDDIGGSPEGGPGPLDKTRKSGAVCRRQGRVRGASGEIVVRYVDDLSYAVFFQKVEIGKRGITAYDSGAAQHVDIPRDMADGGKLRLLASVEMADRMAKVEVGRGDALVIFVERLWRWNDHPRKASALKQRFRTRC